MVAMFHSLHFDVHEFDSHDGDDYPPEWIDDKLVALCSQLDIIRERWGGPLKVVSGYRTPAWNLRIDGATASWHVKGVAADITPIVTGNDRGDRTQAVYRLRDQINDLIQHGRLPLVGGVGYYVGRWCHIDIRPKPADGHIARWSGTGVGSEHA